MKKFTMLDAAAMLIWLLPIAYLAYVYGALPATVPMHYDANGVPNSYGSKGSFLLVQLMVSGVGAFVYLLIRYLPSIDPKKQAQYSEATFRKLSLGILTFISALGIIITYAASQKGFKIDKLLFPMLGLLFAFIGNMMNNIKPNYFAGIRTPWTLEDPETWRATHRLSAKLWFIGGLMITAITLVVTGSVASVIFLTGVAVMVLVPVVYSYIYYKKHRPA
jgi:uncharacterized membrane protein